MSRYRGIHTRNYTGSIDDLVDFLIKYTYDAVENCFDNTENCDTYIKSVDYLIKEIDKKIAELQNNNENLKKYEHAIDLYVLIYSNRYSHTKEQIKNSDVYKRLEKDYNNIISEKEHIFHKRILDNIPELKKKGKRASAGVRILDDNNLVLEILSFVGKTPKKSPPKNSKKGGKSRKSKTRKNIKK